MFHTALDYNELNVFHKYDVEDFLNELNADSFDYNFDDAPILPPEAMGMGSEGDVLSMNLPELSNFETTPIPNAFDQCSVSEKFDIPLPSEHIDYVAPFNSASTSLSRTRHQISSQSKKEQKLKSASKSKSHFNSRECNNCGLPFYSNESECNDCGSLTYCPSRNDSTSNFINDSSDFLSTSLSTPLRYDDVSASNFSSPTSNFSLASEDLPTSPAISTVSSLLGSTEDCLSDNSTFVNASERQNLPKCVASSLTDEEKYRRIKDQNNEASRQYRNRKKNFRLTLQKRLLELEKFNKELIGSSDYLAEKYTECLKLKQDMEAFGIRFADLDIT